MSVASLDAGVVQADEIFAVLISLKTEFQRFFCRGLQLRPVRIRKARVRVFPEIARRIQKDGGTVNHVAAVDLVKEARCATKHRGFHVAYECIGAVCRKLVGERFAAIVLCLPGDGVDLIDHSQTARFPVTNNRALRACRHSLRYNDTENQYKPKHQLRHTSPPSGYSISEPKLAIPNNAQKRLEKYPQDDWTCSQW